MNRRIILQRLLEGLLDSALMSLFVAFSAVLTWVIGS
jgi:hypothetical protein